MVTVPQRPTGANATDPSFTTPPRAVRFEDPADARAWLDAVRTDVEELRDLAHEATDRPSARILSRHELRRRVMQSSVTLTRLLDAAAHGLAAGGHEP